MSGTTNAAGPPEGAVLLLVDVQAGFQDPRWGRRNNPDAEEVAGRLLGRWRERRWPVVHVQHDSADEASPLHPASPGHAPAAPVAPAESEPVVHKSVNSGFIGTDLEQRLRVLAAPAVVVCGISTDHCVSTTARMAGNLGFATWLVADACATFDRVGHDGVHRPAEQVHDLALASLHGEFATVVDSADLLRSRA